MSKKQLKFTATDQVLARTDALKVVGDTIGQYEAAFTLSEWWDGYTATAQFTKNGETIDVLIVDGVCDVPDESVAGNGNMYVNVVSYDGDGNRKTANSVAVPIYASGLKTESAIHAGPTVSIWNVIVTLLKFLTGGLAGQVLRKKSGSDYDAEWATPPIDFDETYYTSGEINTALSGKSDTTHTHAAAEIAYTDTYEIGSDNVQGITDILIGVMRGFSDTLDTKQNKPLTFTAVVADAWESDTTYVDYPYMAAVPLTGVTAAMVPHVYFSGADSISGDYAPPPESYDGGVYIYGKTNAEITIPLIVMEVLS